MLNVDLTCQQQFRKKTFLCFFVLKRRCRVQLSLLCTVKSSSEKRKHFMLWYCLLLYMQSIKWHRRTAHIWVVGIFAPHSLLCKVILFVPTGIFIFHAFFPRFRIFAQHSSAGRSDRRKKESAEKRKSIHIWHHADWNNSMLFWRTHRYSWCSHPTPTSTCSPVHVLKSSPPADTPASHYHIIIFAVYRYIYVRV